MQRPATRPTLEFAGGFDDREAFEASARGYRSHVCVVMPSGERYPVVFYDAVRLQQDLEDEAKSGCPYIADPGLIVLSEITLENMQEAAERLAGEGFFDSFRPLAQADSGVEESS